MIHEHGGNIYQQNIEMDFSVNINPMGCHDTIRTAIVSAVDRVSQYPDLAQASARNSLAELYDISPKNILCGNGASELLMAAVRMVQPKSALVLAPSFFGYEHALGSVQNCEISTYELRQENGFALGEDILDRLMEDTDMFFLANPNNPVGKLVEPELMQCIADSCSEKNITLVIDECFLKLSDTGKSMAGYAASHDNVIVVDAFTKTLAIPGVRTGFAIASADTIGGLRTQLPEWNASVFAEAAIQAGCRLLKDGGYLAKCREYISTEREYLKKELGSLGIKVLDSDSLFMLIYSEKDLYELLLKHGILIRDCSNFRSLTKGFYRIALKTHEENELLVKSVSELTSGQ